MLVWLMHAVYYITHDKPKQVYMLELWSTCVYVFQQRILYHNRLKLNQKLYQNKKQRVVSLPKEVPILGRIHRREKK